MGNTIVCPLSAESRGDRDSSGHRLRQGGRRGSGEGRGPGGAGGRGGAGPRGWSPDCGAGSGRHALGARDLGATGRGSWRRPPRPCAGSSAAVQVSPGRLGSADARNPAAGPACSPATDLPPEETYPPPEGAVDMQGAPHHFSPGGGTVLSVFIAHRCICLRTGFFFFFIKIIRVVFIF